MLTYFGYDEQTSTNTARESSFDFELTLNHKPHILTSYFINLTTSGKVYKHQDRMKRANATIQSHNEFHVT